LRSDAEARQPGREISGGTAEILGESLHVFQPAADLLPVQIHGSPPKADDVVTAISHADSPHD
jgi:hypothetical protein